MSRLSSWLQYANSNSRIRKIAEETQKIYTLNTSPRVDIVNGKAEFSIVWKDENAHSLFDQLQEFMSMEFDRVCKAYESENQLIGEISEYGRE